MNLRFVNYCKSERYRVTHWPQSGLDCSHTQQNSLFCPYSPHTLLRARVKVHIEKFMHVRWLQLCLFFLFNHTLDSFKPTKEYKSMFKAFEIFEIFKVYNLTFVTSAEPAVVSTFMRAFIKDSLKWISHSDAVSPVNTSLQEWFILWDNLTCIKLAFFIKICLVKFYCNSCSFL